MQYSYSYSVVYLVYIFNKGICPHVSVENFFQNDDPEKQCTKHIRELIFPEYLAAKTNILSMKKSVAS